MIQKQQAPKETPLSLKMRNAFLAKAAAAQKAKEEEEKKT